MEEEQLDLVVVGHVDHGKSTVIGRLMADTGSLPVGKLEQVRERCARTSRPFEYAFLLDALKNEQAQGITIDAARCFFRTDKRRAIINDAPGHVEFLKNMVTGASRAQAALLVIDVHEGIRENTKRHGYILSLLGLCQVAVLINKMDLVGYAEEAFCRTRDEYSQFLSGLGVTPVSVIPVSARSGGNIARRAAEMPWYGGPTVLEQVDQFEVSDHMHLRPFRMPLQDVYKFTAAGDDRRIFAGSITSGRIEVGSRVRFLPSRKTSSIATVEGFAAEPGQSAKAGQATGFTLTEQIYVKPGEVMVVDGDESCLETTRLRTTVFWMGRAPLIPNKRYVLKVGASKVPVELREVLGVIDASELSRATKKLELERHDVGEVVLETTRPIACDRASFLGPTGRFVIVDHFEIAGCGVVLGAAEVDESLLERRVRARDMTWIPGSVTPRDRAQRNGHRGKFILFAVGGESSGSTVDFAERLARRIEAGLFERGKQAYYLSIGNLSGELSATNREESVQRLGQSARLLTEAGLLFISTLTEAEDVDVTTLSALNRPAELFVVQVGEVFGKNPVSLVLDAVRGLDAAFDDVLAALGAEAILWDYVI